MNRLWEMFKNFTASVWRGAATVVLAVALLVALIYTFKGLMSLVSGGIHETEALPLLAIGGVIVLILALTIVAVIFGFYGLTDKAQAMGLPEGSIRAVIALSLIVLFAILAVFLYENILLGGPINTIENLSSADRDQFIRDHPTARDLQSVLVKDSDGQAIVAKDKAGQPLKNADGTPMYFYTVTYSTANTTSDDFAKQLLVLLGTLMTAITSFYLGAGTATSAAAAVATLTNPKPTMTAINPVTHSVAKGMLHLQIMGSNLNVITHVRIVRAGTQIVATNVASNPTQVTCDIDPSQTATPQGAPWDVVIDDATSTISATLPGALTITA